MAQAAKRFKAAVTADGSFSKAWSALATAYVMNSFGTQYAASAPTMKLGRSAARVALRLDPFDSDAHAALGVVHHAYDWDFVAARRAFGAALRDNFHSATAHQWLASSLAEQGERKASVSEALLAGHINAANAPIIAATETRVLYFAGRFAEAIARGREIISVYPKFFKAAVFVAQAHVMSGEATKGATMLQRVVDMTHGENWVVRGEWAWALARAGRRRRAEDELAELLKALKSGQYVDSFVLGRVLVGLREYDRAVDEFAKALRARSCWMPSLKTDPAFREIRARSAACRAVIDAVTPRRRRPR